MVRVEYVKGKESQPYAVESLLVDTRRIAHKNLSHLGDFVSTTICPAL
jgi:hypothetical protein